MVVAGWRAGNAAYRMLSILETLEMTALVSFKIPKIQYSILKLREGVQEKKRKIYDDFFHFGGRGLGGLNAFFKYCFFKPFRIIS